jgi:hypothetical protein
VRIALLPRQAAMVRIARGFRPRVLDCRSIPCQPDDGAAGWAAALEALRKLLPDQNGARADATVILSSHFARYLVVPWSPELVTPSEELEFARARYVQVYGQTAHDWSVAMNPSPAGAGRLCAAVDQALIAAVGGAVAASPLRLRSMQPALMALFNDWRRRIGNDAWLVLAEQGRLVVAWIAGGRWRSVRARPHNGAPIPLEQVLEQERLLVSAGSGQRVFLATLGDVAVDMGDIRVEPLAPRRGPHASRESDAGYALAMCGA